MEKEQQYKKMLITVNGKPVGREIWIDKITYAPVFTDESAVKPAGSDAEAAVS
ncbi:hypothetical protein P4H66_18540 [Paenibacillus dokdonensis]|uniref:Uncharacterized protein n=1 Tax=Paenibacillus dokdonensis TaxID=2567944 RepID=A0ABU6GQ24_9BACL|nr:hypothetical protein [Paenibacillus dokdonensis]MEC0241818.1 hypothetical protein [Paenibacillus dokdonensis]